MHTNMSTCEAYLSGMLLMAGIMLWGIAPSLTATQGDLILGSGILLMAGVILPISYGIRWLTKPRSV